MRPAALPYPPSLRGSGRRHAALSLLGDRHAQVILGIAVLASVRGGVRGVSAPASHARLGELPDRRGAHRRERPIRVVRRADHAVRPRLPGSAGAARRGRARRTRRGSHREHARDAGARSRRRVPRARGRSVTDGLGRRRARHRRLLRDASQRSPRLVGAALLRDPRVAAHARRRARSGPRRARLAAARSVCCSSPGRCF